MTLPAFINKPLQKQISKFVAKRSKIASEITLNQKRIYIFLSKEGILYGLLLLITFISGVNYANNLVLGLCFYLGSVFVICIHYTYAQLSGLNIKLLEVSDSQVNGKVRVSIQISATGSKPHKQLQFAFQLGNEVVSKLEKDATVRHTSKPEASQTELGYITHVTLSRVLEPQIVTFYLPAITRGKYELPRLKVSSVYPLGILQTWTYCLFTKTSWIWPKPLAFTQYGQDFTLASSEATISGHKKGNDDFDRLDNYIEGESLARVSWRHVASGRGMLTKHFADPVGKDVLLDYANMPSSNHEQKLSQLSFAVQQLSQSMTPFALTLPSGQLTLNAGSDHEKNALILLAKAPKVAHNVPAL